VQTFNREDRTGEWTNIEELMHVLMTLLVDEVLSAEDSFIG
jgi:hypothetical protein